MKKPKWLRWGSGKKSSVSKSENLKNVRQQTDKRMKQQADQKAKRDEAEKNNRHRGTTEGVTPTGAKRETGPNG